jgi:hypothetical protein
MTRADQKLARSPILSSTGGIFINSNSLVLSAQLPALALRAPFDRIISVIRIPFAVDPLRPFTEYDISKLPRKNTIHKIQNTYKT